MIRGGHATLDVADVERAAKFYVETLGFKLRGQVARGWAEVDAGEGLVIGLRRAEAGGARAQTRVELEVNAPIEDVVAVLANRGVVFEGGVTDDAGVKVAVFRDLDGNALHLCEPRQG